MSFQDNSRNLSHINSLAYSREFYLCLYKHSKTLIVSKNFKQEVKSVSLFSDLLVSVPLLEKVKFLTLQVS